MACMLVWIKLWMCPNKKYITSGSCSLLWTPVQVLNGSNSKLIEYMVITIGAFTFITIRAVAAT